MDGKALNIDHKSLKKKEKENLLTPDLYYFLNQLKIN
jgi:hypothetical protein